MYLWFLCCRHWNILNNFEVDSAIPHYSSGRAGTVRIPSSTLSNLPDRCREEVLKVLGSRKACVSDMPSMPYIQATIAEVQWISCVSPASIPHATTAPTIVSKRINFLWQSCIFHEWYKTFWKSISVQTIKISRCTGKVCYEGNFLSLINGSFSGI